MASQELSEVLRNQTTQRERDNVTRFWDRTVEQTDVREAGGGAESGHLAGLRIDGRAGPVDVPPYRPVARDERAVFVPHCVADPQQRLEHRQRFRVDGSIRLGRRRQAARPVRGPRGLRSGAVRRGVERSRCPHQQVSRFPRRKSCGFYSRKETKERAISLKDYVKRSLREANRLFRLSRHFLVSFQFKGKVLEMSRVFITHAVIRAFNSALFRVNNKLT